MAGAAGPAGGAVNAAEAAYAAGWRVVRALPGPVARGLFTAGADIATRRGGRGVGLEAQLPLEA